MAGTTTAFCSSGKTDLMSALHCLNGSLTFTATTVSTNNQLTSVSALTALAVGMFLSGTGIPTGAVISSVDGSATLTMGGTNGGSDLATASNSGVTVTAVGDTFKLALVKVTPTGTYGAATTSYTQLTGNSDEVSGTGYSAGGVALGNVTPSLSGTTAMTTFSPNPSWTTATFSATGALLYNNTRRGPILQPTVAVFDFGGTQTVTGGTFTVLMPSETSSTAILRLA